jgi:hypothetical protein
MNRIDTRTLQGRSPFQVLLKRAPDVKGVKFFACLAYANVLTKLRNKLDPKAKPMILVGGPHGQTYPLFDPESQRITNSRHVRFDETEFPGFSLQVRNDSRDDNVGQHVSLEEDDLSSSSSSTSAEDVVMDADDEAECDDQNHQHNSDQDNDDMFDSGWNSALNKLFDGKSTDEEDGTSSTDKEVDGDAGAPSEQLRYPARSLQAPSRFVAAMSTGVSLDNDKLSLNEAMASEMRDEWSAAILTELNELQGREVWQLVDRPRNARVLPCKLLLKVKRRPMDQLTGTKLDL